jgi:hypothetical protein
LFCRDAPEFLIWIWQELAKTGQAAPLVLADLAPDLIDALIMNVVEGLTNDEYAWEGFPGPDFAVLRRKFGRGVKAKEIEAAADRISEAMYEALNRIRKTRTAGRSKPRDRGKPKRRGSAE